MLDDKKLTNDEQRIINELTDKIIEASKNKNINRSELFSRLSTLIEGVKLGLTSTAAQAVI